MSSTPAVTPAAKPDAIQILEQELLSFFKQREEAISRVHALDGAIQGGQHILAKLKAAATEAKAEAVKLVSEVKKAETEVVAEAKAVETKAEAVAEKVEAAVKTEVSKVLDFVKKA